MRHPPGWKPQTGAVGNRTYRVGLNAVRLGNRTYPDKLGSKSRGESVYLFLEFTISHPKAVG